MRVRAMAATPASAPTPTIATATAWGAAVAPLGVGCDRLPLDVVVVDVQVEVVLIRVDGGEAGSRPGRVGREGRALGIRLAADAVGEGPGNAERVDATGDEPRVGHGG